jgi:phosphatidylethanolamine-binding protein (PEBP) family uncharacterized protein
MYMGWTRKNIRRKKQRRKTRRKTRGKRGGGTELVVKYGLTKVSGQMLTNNSKTKPQIQLLNAPPTTNPFLVIMLDPDAPAGTWTHYVALLQPDGKVLAEPYKYQPPQPPPGTGAHRYIFTAYALPAAYELPAAYALPAAYKNGHDYYTSVLQPWLAQKSNSKIIAEPVQFLAKNN